jgi:hypothetical protein
MSSIHIVRNEFVLIDYTYLLHLFFIVAVVAYVKETFHLLVNTQCQGC